MFFPSFYSKENGVIKANLGMAPSCSLPLGTVQKLALCCLFGTQVTLPKIDMEVSNVLLSCGTKSIPWKQLFKVSQGQVQADVHFQSGINSFSF